MCKLGIHKYELKCCNKYFQFFHTDGVTESAGRTQKMCVVEKCRYCGKAKEEYGRTN